MSQKIITVSEEVVEELKVPDEVASFVSAILMFECFEKTYQYKKRYKEELDKVCK